MDDQAWKLVDLEAHLLDDLWVILWVHLWARKAVDLELRFVRSEIKLRIFRFGQGSVL